MTSPRIVIIGGGPTGLGAAVRCHDLGHENWTLIDSAPAGGLSRSFVDAKGFTWDLGGHVIFSHYAYFDDVMEYSTQEWLTHERESWVFLEGVWVPYPFQNNIHRLPAAAKEECLDGLLEVYKEKYTEAPKHFEEYFTRQFGKGIAKYFMSPYNFKVWAVPPSKMGVEWMGERVATVDVRRVARNVIRNTDDLGWGPNATFKFPLHGGTGGIWVAPGGQAAAGQDEVRQGRLQGRRHRR
jgi:protoporphyrinogen oxidase